jgi:hypothetical protein
MSRVGEGTGCALLPLSILEWEAEQMVFEVFRHEFGVFRESIAAFLPKKSCARLLR